MVVLSFGDACASLSTDLRINLDLDLDLAYIQHCTQGAPPNGPFSAEGALPNQMNWPEAGVFGVLWTQRRPKTPRTKLPVVVSSAAVGRFLFPRRSDWPRDASQKRQA